MKKQYAANTSAQASAGADNSTRRKPYRRPVLNALGAVHLMTRSGGSKLADGMGKKRTVAGG